MKSRSKLLIAVASVLAVVHLWIFSIYPSLAPVTAKLLGTAGEFELAIFAVVVLKWLRKQKPWKLPIFGETSIYQLIGMALICFWVFYLFDMVATLSWSGTIIDFLIQTIPNPQFSPHTLSAIAVILVFYVSWFIAKRDPIYATLDVIAIDGMHEVLWGFFGLFKHGVYLFIPTLPGLIFIFAYAFYLSKPRKKMGMLKYPFLILVAFDIFWFMIGFPITGGVLTSNLYTYVPSPLFANVGTNLIELTSWLTSVAVWIYVIIRSRNDPELPKDPSIKPGKGKTIRLRDLLRGRIKAKSRIYKVI